MVLPPSPTHCREVGGEELGGYIIFLHFRKLVWPGLQEWAFLVKRERSLQRNDLF